MPYSLDAIAMAANEAVRALALATDDELLPAFVMSDEFGRSAFHSRVLWALSREPTGMESARDALFVAVCRAMHNQLVESGHGPPTTNDAA